MNQSGCLYLALRNAKVGYNFLAAELSPPIYSGVVAGKGFIIDDQI